MRELAADAALRQRVGRALSRPRARRRRRALPRVRVRARPRQRASRDPPAGRRLPGRHRQRLRHLAVAGEPVLARPLPRRSRRPNPLPPLRRGQLRGDRASDPAAPGHRRGEPSASTPGGLAEAADWDTLRSGETYLGYGRGAGRADSPAQLALNHWALSGDWAVEEESAVLSAARGSLTFRFHARDLNLVLTPPTSGAPVRFTVLLDGQPPGDDHGLDINELGQGTVDEPRMYQLVRHRGGGAERDFEITFHDPGVRAYVFTFG